MYKMIINCYVIRSYGFDTDDFDDSFYDSFTDALGHNNCKICDCDDNDNSSYIYAMVTYKSLDGSNYLWDADVDYND